jgi:tape measure domain-containing protein
MDTSRLERAIRQSNTTVKNWASGIETQAAGIDSAMKKIGGAVAAYFSFQAMAEFSGKVIEARGEIQNLQTAFETMLNSKYKADKMMEEIVDFAMTTPFEMVDVASNVKMLLAMGVAAEDSLATLKSLGDVAAGLSVPLNRIAMNYGQVLTLGKLEGREVRDFAMMGVPLMDELAKNLGKARSEIDKMVTDGAIKFKDVAEAFKTMTGEGGRFNNLMARQMSSVTGQISNLKDRIHHMLNAIGEQNEGIIYAGVEGTTKLVENWETIADVLKGLILTYGSYKVAMMVAYQWHLAENQLIAAKRDQIAAEAIARETAATEAAAAAAKEAAAQEAATAAQNRSTAAAERTKLAKRDLLLATEQLIAAERAYALAAVQAGEAYALGAATEEQILLKKELNAVEKARLQVQETSMAVNKAMTAEVVVNEAIQAEATMVAEQEKIAATNAGTAAETKQLIMNQAATAGEIRHAMSKKLLAAAQALLNATMLNNPYIAAAAGLAAIGYITYKIVTHQTELEKQLTKTNLELHKEKSEVAMLFGELKSLEKGTKEYEAVKKEILELYGKYIPKQLQELQNYKDQEAALKAVNGELEMNIRLKGKQDAKKGLIGTTEEELEKQRKVISKKIEGVLTAEEQGQLKGQIEKTLATYREGVSFVTGKQLGTKELNKEFDAELTKIRNTWASKFGTDNIGKYSDFVSALRKMANATKEFREQNEGIDKAFKQNDILDIPDPRQGQKVFTTAAKERKALQEELIKKTKELKQLEKAEMEVKPGDKKNKALDAIEAKKKEIEEIKDLLGMKTTDEKKAADKQIEQQKKLMDMDMQMGKKRIQNTLETNKQLLEAGLVNTEDFKNLAESRYKYEKETLDKEKAERIKVLNELAGGTPDVPKITTLPLVEQEAYNKKYIALEDKKNKTIQEMGTRTVAFMLHTEEGKNREFIKMAQDSVGIQKAQIWGDYQEELQRINQDEQDALNDLNIAKGGIDEAGKKVKGKYIETMPEQDRDAYNQRRVAAEQKLQDSIGKIDQIAADRTKKLMRDIYQFSVGEAEKERQQIKSRYDEQRKEAAILFSDKMELQKALTAINEQEGKEIEAFNQNLAFKTSSFYEKMFSDIQNYSYVTVSKMASDIDKMLSNAKQTAGEKGETMYIVDYEEIDKEGKAVKKSVTITTEEFIKLRERLTEMQKNIKERNPFKEIGEGYKKLKDAITKNDKKGIADAIQEMNEGFDKGIKIMEEWGQSLDQIFGGQISKTFSTIKELGSGVFKIGAGIGQLATGDIVGGITNTLKGAATLVDVFSRGEKAYREAQKKWMEEIIGLQLEINNLLIDEMQIRKGGNVFIADYAKDALQNARAIQEAQRLFSDQWKKPINVELTGKLTNEYIKDITRIGDSYKNLEEYLTALPIKIGIARKKILGITVGQNDVYGSLFDTYPKLINDSKELNVELAKSVLNMGDALPDATRQALEALIRYQEQINESRKAIEDSISSIAGFVSGNLASALVDAWDNGEDAFNAFKDSVTAGLKQITSQMVYNEVFSQAFTDLQGSMKESLSLTGDQNFTDDFQVFFQKAPLLVKQWQEGMKEAEKQATAAGFDFQGLLDDEKKKGLQGEINRMTEETGGELAGLVRREADDIRVMRDLNKAGINHLVNIEANTFNTVEEAKKMLIELKAINANTKPIFSGIGG